MALPFISAAKIRQIHIIQWIHIINCFFALLAMCLLISIAVNIRSFISNGAMNAGFGNYNIFAYPATYVYMLIPTICSLVYSAILACDPSPSYAVWRPSKTFISTVACYVGAFFLASLLPLLPHADIITTPDPAIACTWADFMTWRVIYNNPDIYPWVTRMDTACQTLKAADAFCWIILLLWTALLIFYIRVTRRGLVSRENYSEKQLPMTPIRRESKTESC
ncbi:hypothetical protein BX666DRAFT_1896536 [Dichotomocladium elegans]|nr:hypothetical protein BX666DRAFT_1896536 [Dichotomocladium elegans]